MAKRPDIILITSDQMRPHELGCHGGTQVAIPDIDRLVARSVLISGQHNRTAKSGRTNVA